MFRRPNRIIVPQYAAPSGLSLLAAAELVGEGKRAIAAQIVALAVRKVVAVAPVDVKRRKKTGFELRLRSVNGLSDDEVDLVDALFPRRVIGETVIVAPGRNARLGRRLRKPHARAVARLVVAGLARERHWYERSWRAAQPVVPLEASFPLVDHLWGVRDYIALAEKDRLAFLQSPSGAQLRFDAEFGAEVLLLNEKLLGLAVLFGLEKEWIRELGVTATAVDPAQLDAMSDLGELLFYVLDPDVLESLSLLGDLADVLDGVGAVIGGIAEGIFSGL
jgi:hypothetical protein